MKPNINALHLFRLFSRPALAEYLGESISRGSSDSPSKHSCTLSDSISSAIISALAFKFRIKLFEQESLNMEQKTLEALGLRYIETNAAAGLGYRAT